MADSARPPHGPGRANQFLAAGGNPAVLPGETQAYLAHAHRLLADLQKRYGGNTDAILAAYNAGPGRANQFLAAGGNPAVLPGETQAYLAHAHRLLAKTGPAVETPYTAAPSQLEIEAAKMGITMTTPASANQAMAQSPMMSSAGPGAVTVEISFANAPPGMKSRVQTKGPVIVNTKIGYAMPEGVS